MFQIGPPEIGADLAFGVDLALFILQCTNKSTISNIFNEHFTTVGSKLAAKLPSSEKHLNKFLYNEKSLPSSFLFQPITPNEVKLEIMSMPANKSPGFYSCSTFILRYA